EIRRLADQYQFFHWHLAFPHIFRLDAPETSGFDVILGNPPWDQVQMDAREFFAVSAPAIAEAPNMAARNKKIDRLATTDPVLYQQFQEASREVDGIKHFAHSSGRYPLT